MAGTRRFADEVRWFSRWVHTTPRAIEATQLAVAVVLALVILGAVSVVSDIGRWGLLLAAVPLATQAWPVVQSAGRRTEGTKDLPTGSLVGVDLTNADLSASDLRTRDLSDARLTSANLIGVDLAGASVAGARLRRADLSYGSLEGAACTKASFFRCRLVESDLRRVDARLAGFERADLRGADLVGANLLGAAFRGADVRGADFTGAKLAPDALADTVMDRTTILADGTAAERVGVPMLSRFVPPAGLALSGVLWSVARPAFHGLAWASLLTGAVVAVESSGGGLGDELAILTRTDPVVGVGSGGGQVRRVPSQEDTSRSSAGSIPDLDDSSTSGSAAGETELVPPPGSDPGGDEDDEGDTSETGSAGGGSDAAGTGAPGNGAGNNPSGVTGVDLDSGSGLSEVTTGPDRAAAQTEEEPGEAVADDPPTSETTETTQAGQPEPDPVDSTTSVPSQLTEVEVPVTSVLAGLQRVQMVVSSQGGASTVTSASSLGQLEPRLVTGQDGWELTLPSGEVRVQVTPNDASVATACQILVDGAERSFQSGLAGQTSTCIVDLDPAG